MKLPLFVICDLVGLPTDDAELMRRGAEACARLAVSALETEDSRIALHRDLAAFHAYLQGHVDRARREPPDNLLGHLVRLAPEDGVPLTDQEIISLLSVVNVGGHETTTNGLGNMFYLCFADPALQQRLRDRPDDVPNFLEEALRFESPVAALPRWVVEDTEVNGVKLPAGACLQMSFAAMNRDPARFEHPATLDLGRPDPRKHMAFGLGPHFCPGAILARLEMLVSIRRILARLKDIRVEGDGAPLPHDPKLVVRALQRLPVTFSKA